MIIRRQSLPPNSNTNDLNAFLVLPNEILLFIMSYLNVNELSSLSETCRRLWSVTADNKLWTNLSLSPFRESVDDRMMQILFHRKFKSITRQKCCSNIDFPDIMPKDTNILRVKRYILKHLDLARCSNITDKSIYMLSRNSGCSPFLLHLNLSQCTKITDKSLMDLASSTENMGKYSTGCPNLVFLNLTHCSITDIGLNYLAKGCKKLKDLRLRSCDSIKTLKCLWTEKMILENLDIGLCSGIEERDIIEILLVKEGLTELLSIDISFTAATDDTLLYLVENKKNLQLKSIICGGCNMTEGMIREIKKLYQMKRS